MKILLSALSPKILDAFTHFFGRENDVEIVDSSIVELECDAVVSPANSFGFMDGGLGDAQRYRLELNPGAKIYQI